MAKSLNYRQRQALSSETPADFVLAGPGMGGGGGMDLREFLVVLRSGAWWIVLMTVLGVAASAAITFAMTPVYTAKATLFVTVNSSQDSAYARGQFALQRVASYPQLINDPQLVNEVITKLDLDRDFQDVKASLTATNPKDTVLISISATAPEAQEAADIANTAAPLLAGAISKLENTNPKELTVKAEQSVPAATPPFATSPRKGVNLALGLVAGLSLGLLLALLLYRLDPRIRRASDVERKLRMRVLGTVDAAALPGQKARRAGRELGYRQLVSNLLMANDGRMPQRILLVGERHESAIDARQLAQTLAALGKRAVIVEGDGKGKALNAGQDGQPGLGQVLAGSATLDDALVRIDSVPMGYLPTGPEEAALRRYDVFSGFDALVASLEADFDVVIVLSCLDAAPVDATAAALHSDCVLVICRENSTTYRQITRTVGELSAVRVGATGLVILKRPRLFERRARG